MWKGSRAAWIALFLIPLCLGQVRAGELADRQAVMDNAAVLIQAGKYAELDRLAVRYRDTRSRTESGAWKLLLLYSGMIRAAATCHCGPGSPEELRAAEAVEQRMLQWMRENPDSAAARIGYAAALVQHAWMARGSRNGSEVPAEALRGFQDYLERARLFLDAHRGDGETDPQWYVEMLWVTIGQGWPLAAFQALVDEATARHPDYTEIYLVASDYLLPKWHGSAALLENFASAAVEKTDPRDGMAMYARIYWHASTNQFKTRLFEDSRVVWASMAQGIDDVLRVYPDARNVNSFARFSCLAGDKAKTRDLIGRLENTPDPAIWVGAPAFADCRDWAAR